jgi:hypothetical protein
MKMISLIISRPVIKTQTATHKIDLLSNKILFLKV